jgi:hypothetical protein
MRSAGVQDGRSRRIGEFFQRGSFPSFVAHRFCREMAIEVLESAGGDLINAGEGDRLVLIS